MQFQEIFSCQEDNLNYLGHLLYIYVLLKVLFRLCVGPARFLFHQSRQLPFTSEYFTYFCVK
jgi:hypothetical protein